MRQIIQSFKTGETILEEVPAPEAGAGQLLIRTRCSLVSLGTEKMLVEFGKSNLISKARQQPDKVKQVLDKIRAEGLLPTLEAVFNKLEQPIPLGYCNVGQVVAVGRGVSGFQVGDRVASNGPHAEFVSVPVNLCARLPDNVTDEQAAFTVISSIGLQGIRLANPTLGETVVVIGLGLIGLLTAQLLMAQGCRVIGTDFDQRKVELAKQFGIDALAVTEGTDVVKWVESATGGVGADAVIITASTRSDEVISKAARMSRKRGRIILVGVIGLSLSRAEFFEKELSFQVSCSYGPGRYDENYEQRGQDYPLPFVRWTEQRNFEAVLQMISTGRIKVDELITERVDLTDYKAIYGSMGKGGSIASLLIYPKEALLSTKVETTPTNSLFPGGVAGQVGIIGAGNFTKMTMLPAMKKTDALVAYIASQGGVSGTYLAKKWGIRYSTTRYADMLEDAGVDMVMITTRHDKHAPMTIESLRAGKHVFVEKPLALNREQLDQIVAAQANSGKTVSVGFNRRFSPHALKMKQLLGNDPGPMSLIATMNAGAIPPNVWVHDMQTGGGRIIGEACHFIDLCAYLTGSPVVAVCANALGPNPPENTDNVSFLLRFENGSQAVVNYFSNGHKAYSKERLEAYSLGRTLILDNFRTLEGFGFKGFSKLSTKLDKGHANQFTQLFKVLKSGGQPIIPFESLVNATLASFAVLESLKTGGWVQVN